MAIGNADFTNDAKKGMGWFYNNDHSPHTEEWKAKIRMAMKSKEVRKKMIAAQGLRRARERGDNAVG